MRRNWTGNCDVFLEYRGLVNQHVGAAVGKTLVGNHVFLRNRGLDIIDEGHGLGRVADVLVKSRRFVFRRIEGKDSAAVEIKGPGFRTLRRPFRITPPHIRSGFKDEGSRKFGITAAQVLLEKREQDVLAIEIARLGGEFNPAQALTVVASPSAVDPGTDYERVENSRVVLIDSVEGAEGTLQILGVEPSPHRENGTMDVLHVRRKISDLPIFVIGVTTNLIIKKTRVPVQVFFQIYDRAGVEIEIVGALRAEIERNRILGRQFRIFLGLEKGVEVEICV